MQQEAPRNGIPLDKLPSSEVPKFRELQVTNFQAPKTSSSEILKKKLTKKCFFPFQQETFQILPFAFPRIIVLPSCAHEWN